MSDGNGYYLDYHLQELEYEEGDYYVTCGKRGTMLLLWRQGRCVGGFENTRQGFAALKITVKVDKLWRGIQRLIRQKETPDGN